MRELYDIYAEVKVKVFMNRIFTARNAEILIEYNGKTWTEEELEAASQQEESSRIHP
jgi:hypothetical protein